MQASMGLLSNLRSSVFIAVDFYILQIIQIGKKSKNARLNAHFELQFKKAIKKENILSQIHLPPGWNLRLKEHKILLNRVSIFCQKCNWYSWNTSLGISRNLWYIVLRICLYTKGRNSKEWKNVLVMMGVEAMSSELWTFQCLMCKEI